MRMFLVTKDGIHYEISPFSVSLEAILHSDIAVDAENRKMGKIFEETVKWSGANDTAYKQFLLHNQLHDLDSFNDETMQHAKIEIEPFGVTIYDKSITYGEHDSRGCYGCLPDATILPRMVPHQAADFRKFMEDNAAFWERNPKAMIISPVPVQVTHKHVLSIETKPKDEEK